MSFFTTPVKRRVYRLKFYGLSSVIVIKFIMGSICAKPLEHVPYSYESTILLKDGIEIINSESTSEKVEGFKDCISKAFIGSDTVAPEGGFYWMANGDYSDGNPVMCGLNPVVESVVNWVVNTSFDRFKHMKTLFHNLVNNMFDIICVKWYQRTCAGLGV